MASQLGANSTLPAVKSWSSPTMTTMVATMPAKRRRSHFQWQPASASFTSTTSRRRAMSPTGSRSDTRRTTCGPALILHRYGRHRHSFKAVGCGAPGAGDLAPEDFIAHPRSPARSSVMPARPRSTTARSMWGLTSVSIATRPTLSATSASPPAFAEIAMLLRSRDPIRRRHGVRSD
jgi:hypothetical protein